MKSRLLFLVPAGCLAALALCLFQVPSQVRADYEVPEKYRDTVSKGLEYLVKHQHKDGHWEGDEGKHPTAMTALAGIALLMEGSSVQQGKYSGNLRQAVDWLMDQSQRLQFRDDLPMPAQVQVRVDPCFQRLQPHRGETSARARSAPRRARSVRPPAASAVVARSRMWSGWWRRSTL